MEEEHVAFKSKVSVTETRHKRLDHQNGTESKKKKKKKHHDSKRNAEGTDGDRNNYNGTNRDETVVDGSVVITGKNAGDAKYETAKNFSDSGMQENVLECCKGFEKTSPIQSRAWPFLLDRRVLIGIASTGLGKTLAFGIPAIVHVLRKRKGKGPKGRNPLCLVLSPSRELAQQISDVMCDAGSSCGVKSICLYSRTSKSPHGGFSGSPHGGFSGSPPVGSMPKFFPPFQHPSH